MKRLHITVAALFVAALIFSIAGCSDKPTIEQLLNHDFSSSQVIFHVGVESVSADNDSSDELKSVTRSQTTTFSEFEFHLVKKGSSSVETKIFKKYDFALNRLYVDGIDDGSYTMYILAASGNTSADNARFNEVERLSDCWLEFTGSEFTVLEALYYRGELSLEIAGGSLTTSLPNISLNHLLGRTTFKPQYNSEIVERGTTNITVSSKNSAVASAFSLAGTASKGKSVGEVAIEGDEKKVYLPPTLDGDVVTWVFTHSFSASLLDDIVTQYSMDRSIESATSKSVTVNLLHKYDDYGVRYFTKEAATNYGQGDVKFTKILTLDEAPADYVHNGTTPRNIKLRNPNSATFNSSKPELSSLAMFNMQAIGSVGVYAKIDGSEDRYKIIQFDSLPPFVELENVAIPQGQKLFHTQDGRWHRVDINETSVLSDLEVSYDGNDEFSQFIRDIKVEWTIGFNNNASWYEAFPDGQFARECLCQMFNIAWIHSQDSYWTYLKAHLIANQLSSRTSILWGDSTEEIDWDHYYTTMMNYPSWKIGRVPDGRGVAGYGWHYQFSVIDDFWLNCYGWASYKFYTILHEMGHGWVDNDTSNHVSNLVSGGSYCTAIICANYFVANMSSLPFPNVASITTLRNTHSAKN